MQPPPFAVDVDAGTLGAAGAFLLAAGGGIWGGTRWLLTRSDGNKKTEVSGLWEIIRATEKAAEKMETTFDAMVKEREAEREAHAECRIGYSELYQIAATQHGLLKELVSESSNPNRWIPEMPPKREENYRRMEERQALDKAVDEVKQRTMLLVDAKKAAESSSSIAPKTGAKQ